MLRSGWARSGWVQFGWGRCGSTELAGYSRVAKGLCSYRFISTLRERESDQIAKRVVSRQATQKKSVHI